MPPEPTATGRPRASWVMGRSARWHDPDLRAEMAMQELAGRRAALPASAARRRSQPPSRQTRTPSSCGCA